MRRIEDYNNDVWEKFLNFVFPDKGDLSQREVQSELQKLGIDIRPAWDKVQMALSNCRDAEHARSELESAKRERSSILAKLKGLPIPLLPAIREEIIKLVQQHFTKQKQAVYFRKLEETASDEDLKVLLEDILRLDELSKDSNDVEA